MRRRHIIVGSLVAFVAAAAVMALLLSRTLGDGRSRPNGDPAAFVSHVVGLIVADDYAAAWASLNPAHKAVATRREYVECERMTPVGSKLKSIEVVRVADRSLQVPGGSHDIAAKAVTLRIAVRNERLGTSETFKHTFNAVPDGSNWTWILTPDRYALYRDNACGGI